jgi:FAD/FMN-containing dehydrogenase
MTIVTPSSEEEIVALVTACTKDGRKIRVRGAGKSHPDVIATDYISLSMEHFATITAIDAVNRTVTVGPAMLIEDLCDRLWDEGFTVQGIGSVAGQTVGGLIATGAHGHTLEMSCLAAYVTALRIIDGNGKLHQLSQQQNPAVFHAFPVAMGCLGIITEVVLSIVPRYHVRKAVSFVPFREQRTHWAVEVISSSSSMIKLYPDTGVAAVVTLNPCDGPADGHEVSRCYEGHFQFYPKTYPRPPLDFLQRMQARFRLLPMRIANKLGMQHHESLYISIGYAVPMAKAEKALQLLDRLYVQSYPWLRGSYGIRATKADDLWLSMGYREDVCHIGCYLTSSYGTASYMEKAENILRSLGGRPHWGKPFDTTKVDLASVYPKWQEFKALRQTMDPNGVFENEWTRQIFSN